VVPASSGTFYGHQMTAGHIYTVAGDGKAGYSGDGGLGTSASLAVPAGVTVDHAANLVVADYGNQRIRVVADSSGMFYGQQMTRGHIYTVAGDGRFGFSGDGGPATEAQVNFPSGTAVDHAENLMVADTYNNRIRMVAVTTGTFFGQKMTAGDIYTVAGDGQPGLSGDGGPATKAQVKFPRAVAVDQAGNLVVADSDNQRIRVVAATSGTFYGRKMTAGDIYTVAGSGPPGFSGDGGPATKARLAYPQGIAVDRAGNLLIGDSLNNRVRVVAATSGTFYGVAMTANDIYTVAGNGQLGLSGLGGPASSAELLQPTQVAVDGAGNIYFGGDRVLKVSG
jgi:hypothetical protein